MYERSEGAGRSRRIGHPVERGVNSVDTDPPKRPGGQTA